MSAPPAAVFDRLRKLVAIDPPGARETKTVTEVFTGNDLTTIPVGTADDVVAAFQRARDAAHADAVSHGCQFWGNQPSLKL